MNTSRTGQVANWVTIVSGALTIAGVTAKDLRSPFKLHPFWGAFVLAIGIALITYGLCARKASMTRSRAFVWALGASLLSGMTATSLLLYLQLRHAQGSRTAPASIATPVSSPTSSNPTPRPARREARSPLFPHSQSSSAVATSPQPIQNCINGNCIGTNYGTASVNNYGAPELTLSLEQAQLITGELKVHAPLSGKLELEMITPVSLETQHFVESLAAAIRAANTGLDVSVGGEFTYYQPLPKGISFGIIEPSQLAAAQAFGRALVKAQVVTRDYKFHGQKADSDTSDPVFEVYVQHP